MKKSIGSGRGSVYNILLKALQTGDKYGYEICKEIEEKTNGSYILKQASLYSGLKRLEAQGDITSYWQDSVLGGRRHYYSLTEKGKERIIRSNFSWTDARDDIVDNLFEKSQLDKEIEEMQNDLNNIKDNQVLSEDNQKNIDYILENTANLGNEKDKEPEAEEKLEEENINEETQEKLEESKENVAYSFGGDDLFSMFNTNYENNEEKLEEKQEEVVEDEEISDNNEEIQNNSFEDEENDEDKQLDLFSISNSSNKDSEEPAVEEIEEDSFDDIMQNMQTVENQDDPFEEEKSEEYVGHEVYEEYSSQKEESVDLYENKEQTLDDEYVDKVAETYNSDDVQTEEKVENNDEIFSNGELEDLFEQNKTEEQNEPVEDNNEENVSTLQKNNIDILEEYRKNHVSFNKFSDSTQFEEPENNFSNYFENNNIFNDVENNEQEDAVQSNENVEEKPKEENVLYYDLTNNKEIDKEEASEPKQSSTLDYKDIFGDLVSSKEEQNKEELLIENKDNEIDSHTNDLNDEKSEVMQENNSQVDDMPRLESDINDINRTFMQSKESQERTYSSSSNFEKYDNSPFEAPERNPFEKYDTYEPMNYNNNSNGSAYNDEVHEQRTNDLAFDKKYANIYNKFEVADYEVRYFKKSNPKNNNNNQSKFISINRLNLAVSCVLCLLMCIATTITLIVSSKNPVNSFQMTCYILSYILLALIILFDFTKYMLNKNKKAHTLNKNESLINLFFAIFVAILSISINLFLGMSFANIKNYMGSFTLPLYYSLYLLVKFPLKKFLSKFANFYN